MRRRLAHEAVFQQTIVRRSRAAAAHRLRAPVVLPRENRGAALIAEQLVLRDMLGLDHRVVGEAGRVVIGLQTIPTGIVLRHRVADRLTR